MKRMAYAVISIGLVFAFAACKWEVPEKVSVTSNADYNFSLGNFEKQLDEDLDLQSMMGSTGEGNNDINTYDYFPGKADKNTQRFLLEIKVRDDQLIAPQPSSPSYDLETYPPAPVHETKELDFNPATFFKGLEEALGSEMAGKIIFSEVPMYFYFDIGSGISANADFEMFYASKDGSLTECTGTRSTILNDTVNNTPKPVYEKEGETVISDLSKKPYAAKADITNMINKCDGSGAAFTSVTDDDQLCVEYTISSFKGTIDATNGVNLAIYAVIELPLSFKVIDNDLILDLHNMTNANGASSGTSTSQTPSEGGTDEEFSKYLQVIDSISIRYISYQLPFYSKGGINLGIDLIGDGKDTQYAPIKIIDKNKPKADSDKSIISLKQKTIIRMKDMSTFNPNVQLQMLKDTVFSVPRNKGVDMSVELNLVTDGTVEIK